MPRVMTARRSIAHVCVFCGSSSGRLPLYHEVAVAVGRTLAAAGIGIVYGGGNVGLMGALADGALAAGGRVIGVIPQRLVDRELAHRNLTELHIVSSMHDRKLLMAGRADAFITLAGGYGTFEEFWEAVTWTQLGIHDKPCGLLNTNGFYDPMLAQIERAVAEGFIRPHNRALVLAESKIDTLLEAIRSVTLPSVPPPLTSPAP
jgi:uncharacterized protein (TIGR00730 family)